MTHARIGRKVPPGLSLDVDLPIPPGITALSGPAGAGKTLLLECLAGFVTPDSGRILLDDVILFDAAARVNIPPCRRKCAYIPPRGALFPHMTLRQNLMFAAARYSRLERHRRVAEALDRFEFADAAARRPAVLSHAETLRGAVARALVGEPKLLLIDDCGIDESLLARIRAAAACPVVLVTADPDLWCAADRLVLLDGGRIVQRGAPLAVLDRPESLEAARLLGIPNLFQGTIAALDPGRGSSRLECDGFSLPGPYIPGHFRGDRVWIAIRPEDVRVHPAGDFIPVQLVRASRRARAVRLEFSHGIFADMGPESFAAQKDNKGWQVEFPSQALRIL